jgi:hypothetical protein
MNARQVSRRTFLGQTALAAAAAALVQAPEFLADGAWFETARVRCLIAMPKHGG